MNGSMAYDESCERELADVLAYFLKYEEITDDTERGICRQIIAKGLDSLTNRQRAVYDEFVDPLLHVQCSQPGCPDEIPLCELIGSDLNGGRCSWCEQVRNKDD